MILIQVVNGSLGMKLTFPKNFIAVLDFRAPLRWCGAKKLTFLETYLMYLYNP